MQCEFKRVYLIIYEHMGVFELEMLCCARLGTFESLYFKCSAILCELEMLLHLCDASLRIIFPPDLHKLAMRVMHSEFMQV